MNAQRDFWLGLHPKPWGAAEQDEYETLFSDKIQEWLDAGHGSCVLRDPGIRSIVENALRHFDGQRYALDAFSVMPNHVHVVFMPLPGHGLEDILHSWKSYTANVVNKALGRTGALWMDERYDHIVRSVSELEHYREYVRENPGKAGLGAQSATVGCGIGLQSDAGFQPVAPQGVPGFQSVASGAAGRMPAPPSMCVRFEVAESATEKGLGFDPAAFSSGGNATCPFCGTVADSGYVKAEGCTGRLDRQFMAAVCTRPGAKGKVYLAGDAVVEFAPDDHAIRRRIETLCHRAGLTVPDEATPDHIIGGGGNCQPYGLLTWGALFTPRQLLCLLTFAAAVRELAGKSPARPAASDAGFQPVESGESAGKMPASPAHATAVATCLATALDREVEDSSSLCRWNPTAEKMQGTFGRQALPMVRDFCEANPFGDSVGDWTSLCALQVNAIQGANEMPGLPAVVARGDAALVPWPADSVDAVVTDPPYYDNVGYAILADFFYVWLKRTIGGLYPEHFATDLTPKKNEAVADPARCAGSKPRARVAYEGMMAQAFAEAHRVLKANGQLAVVYAHKTTLGWSTLVDALRRAGFTVTEAWPLDTEMGSRLLAMDTAALASIIFLVARKREGGAGFQPAESAQAAGRMPAPPLVGRYEDEVQPELTRIVRERVDTLWEMGIAGADLVIAAVGAGLRAFTRHEKVEYANGEEVPAEKFLAEVEGVVLDAMMGRLLHSTAGAAPMSAIDASSRFYVLWRFVYKAAEIDAGEVIVFTYAQHVELDGAHGLSTGKDALVEKTKAKYRARDFTERGQEDRLGLPAPDGQPAPLIDALHRVLWLMENSPRKLPEFLDAARPDRERLRVLAQALAGAALAGKSDEDAGRLVATTTAEQTALGKLLANWRGLVEEGTLFDRSTR